MTPSPSTEPLAAPLAADRTLASIVTERPHVAASLERLGLDYCCGGDRRLDAACAAAGLDPEAVIATLEADGEGTGPEPWAGLDAAGLVDHIEQAHHVYLRQALPRLSELAHKVEGVHGARHPELADIRRTYEALRADLEPHLTKEERVLFPMIRELAEAVAAGEASPTFACGSLHNPISVMLAEHDQVGDLLARLHALTDGYRPPPDGCASYQALFAGLAELEADTHLHVHKENNTLFPAVAALEQAVEG